MTRRKPEWLNDQFLSSCLQDKYSSEVEIIKFTSEPAVPVGNNYGSCIFRVKLNFKKVSEIKTQTLSLIIKTPIEDANQRDLFGALSDVEPRFYYEFLPLAKQFGCDYFAPKCYLSPILSVIVMDDLKDEGYVMKDRCLHLDYDHCRLYAITSATFHAVSIAVHNINADLVESLGKEKLFSNELKSIESYKIMMDQGLECTSDFMEKTEFKRQAKLVRAAKSYLLTEVIKIHKHKEGINSLNQGDPWIPNMMFKYDNSGKLSEMKLIDFQALRFGSPINDLVFFLWTSANHDVREKRLHEIFHIYCDSLKDKLQELKCAESFSYSDLLERVTALNPLILFIVVAFLPMQVYPGSVDVMDLVSQETDLNGQPVNKMAKYFTEHFCNHFLLKYLAQMDHIGVFEYLETCAQLF